MEQPRGAQLLHVRILTNAFYIVLLAISLMVRVPGLGLVIEFIQDTATEHLRAWLADWRGDKALNRAYTIITALWIGAVVSPYELVVQVPLYLKPGRLARHCVSAGHSVLGVGHLGVVPHRGHPHASA